MKPNLITIYKVEIIKINKIICISKKILYSIRKFKSSIAGRKSPIYNK